MTVLRRRSLRQSILWELVVEAVHLGLQIFREALGERKLRVKSGKRVVISAGKTGSLGKFRKIRANAGVELAKLFQEPVKCPRIRRCCCVGPARVSILTQSSTLRPPAAAYEFTIAG
jgi:hypothetical protein